MLPPPPSSAVHLFVRVDSCWRQQPRTLLLSMTVAGGVCELSVIHPGPWALWESFHPSLPRWCTDRTRTQRRHLSSWTRMLFKNTNKCCSRIHSYLRLSCYVDAGPNVWDITWKAQRNQMTPGGTCMSTKYAKQTSSWGSSSRTSHSS